MTKMTSHWTDLYDNFLKLVIGTNREILLVTLNQVVILSKRKIKHFPIALNVSK